MASTIRALFTIWILLLSHIPTLSALALPPASQISAPLASRKLEKRCDNKLQNPSFESGLDPWFTFVQQSWAMRGVYTSSDGGHDGSNFYFGHSNSTIDATLTVSQSYIDIPNGATVECAAWVATLRPGNVGSTTVDVFLDGQSCGSQTLGTTGWTRVGGAVSVSGDGAIHTLAVVFSSDYASTDGWYLWLDDLVVGAGC